MTGYYKFQLQYYKKIDAYVNRLHLLDVHSQIFITIFFLLASTTKTERTGKGGRLYPEIKTLHPTKVIPPNEPLWEPRSITREWAISTEGDCAYSIISKDS